MDRSELMDKIKDSSSDGVNFSLIIESTDPYFNDSIVQTAKFLQSEMFITLSECEIINHGSNPRVYLKGRLLNFVTI
jgi:hypothetical protein